MAANLEPEVTLPWLVRLRWLFLAGQMVALGLAWRLQFELDWSLMVTGVVVGAASNLALAIGTRSSPARWSRAQVIGGVLVLDVALLTVMLAASGGAMNPFTVLYLVYITMSAVVLSARWTAIVAVLSVGGFALLFFLPAEDAPAMAGHAHHHMEGTVGFGHHLQGMWVAFVLATGLTAFFVSRISRAIAAQREQIAALRESGARNARLAALTTLAAGAAHELGSPLGTIAVAAHEAALRLGRSPDGGGEVGADLRLILLEVDRCQDILSRMGARASQSTEHAELLDADELGRRLKAQLGEERAASVAVRSDDKTLHLNVPSEPLVQSLLALVRNALDASAPSGEVVVELTQSTTDTRIAISDRGAGIPNELLTRVGEPFFTTKQPGRGLGLGVFLARAFFESRGGALVIESIPGVGTCATAHLPREALAEGPPA